MSRIVKTLFVIFLSFLMVLCSACGSEMATESENNFYIYFKKANTTELYPVEAEIDLTEDVELLVTAVLKEMKTGADEKNYFSTIPDEISIPDFQIEESNLILNFKNEYLSLKSTQEILCRASLVKTFTQFEKINTVEIRIENQPLALSDGTVVGPENGNRYIDPLSSGLNATSILTTTIYYGTKDGSKLIASSEEISYTNSISKEQAILERLLAGPLNDEKYLQTIASGTKLLSVSTKKDVCYVNFDDGILESGSSCLPEVTIYSVVNSLTEVAGINSVQIAINGSTNLVYLDKIDLTNPITRDLNNVITEE